MVKGSKQSFEIIFLTCLRCIDAPRRPRIVLVRWFLQELRQRGFEHRSEWPLNVEKRGYISISKFIDKVLDEHPQRQRAIFGGNDAVRKARAGDGAERPRLQAFDRVECAGTSSTAAWS